MLNTVDLDSLHDTQDVTITVNDMASLTEMTAYQFSKAYEEDSVRWEDTLERVDELVIFNFLAEIIFPLFEQSAYHFRFNRALLDDIDGDYYDAYIESEFGGVESRKAMIKYISSFHNLDIDESEVYTIIFDVVLWNLYLKGVTIYSHSNELIHKSTPYVEKSVV